MENRKEHVDNKYHIDNSGKKVSNIITKIQKHQDWPCQTTGIHICCSYLSSPMTKTDAHILVQAEHTD